MVENRPSIRAGPRPRPKAPPQKKKIKKIKKKLATGKKAPFPFVKGPKFNKIIYIYIYIYICRA